MKCTICKHGQTEPGSTTVTLERGNMTLVIKGVPAQVCSNCGEAYVDEETNGVLLSTAERQARIGVQFLTCNYAGCQLGELRNDHR